MPIAQSRRRFLTTLSLASAAALVGAPRSLHAEPPPETTVVRLANTAWASCGIAPYIAQDLLQAEGITDVRYVGSAWGKEMQQDTSVWIARGEIDLDWNFIPETIRSIESGVPIKLLAGLHSGCLELVAHDGVQKITDLKGKRIGVDNWNLSAHIFLALVTAYVGLAPNRDIQWVTSEEADMELGSMELFVNGKIDAFLAFPPQPQLLRARKIGHSILNTTLDQPWSQYYCCTAAVSADYIGGYPVATKRVLRAVLKAADLRYDRWRDFDIEDTIRFYALRMQEMGLSKAGPNKIIADGTDWRFINELKREMRS